MCAAGQRYDDPVDAQDYNRIDRALIFNDPIGIQLNTGIISGSNILHTPHRGCARNIGPPLVDHAIGRVFV